MKKFVLAATLILTFSSLPAFSATPPKPGANCSKQGMTKTYKGKKFTCIKSGKRLVWNKGVINMTSSQPSIPRVPELPPQKPATPILYREEAQQFDWSENGSGARIKILIPEYPLENSVILQMQILPDPLFAGWICRHQSWLGPEIPNTAFIPQKSPTEIYCQFIPQIKSISVKTYAVRHKGGLNEQGYCGVDCFDRKPTIVDSDWAKISTARNP